MKHSRPVHPFLAVPLAATALTCLAGLAAGQTWTELGPAPLDSYTGRVSSIAASRTNAFLYYVAGADGGVWKTTDAGVSWTPLTDHLATTAVGAIAVDPLDDRIVYVGTGEANFANHSRYGLGVFKTTDAGATWQHLAETTFAGRCFSKIEVDPIDRDTLYASVARAGGFPTLAAAKGHPGGSGPVGVFKSTDAGVTWTLLAGGLPSVDATDIAIAALDHNTVYAAIGHIFGNTANGVYKSTNAGATWTKLAGGLPTSNVGRVSLDVAPSDPNRVFALFTNRADASGGGASAIGAYRSDNAGTSWTAAGSVDQATYGWYLSFVGIKPSNSNIAFYGGLAMARHTVGGSTSDVTPPHVDCHAIAWDASGRLLVGDDGGLHRSSNDGASWSSLNTGLGLVQLYAGLSTHPTDDNYVLAGMQDNGTNRRTTDTKQWQSVLGGDGGWTQLDRASPARVFGEFQGTGNLYRSTNSGGSFSFSGSGLSGRNCFLPPYLIDPENSNTMYYGSERLFRSTNGGSSWSVRSADLTDGAGAIRALAIAPSNPSVIYAATNDGNVSVSTDAGLTFTQRMGAHPGWPRVTRELTVDPDDAATVYLATAFFGADQVRRSTDFGATWTTLDGDLPDIPVNVIAVDSRPAAPVLYAGTDSGLYRSTDSGAHWSLYGTGLPRACVVDIDLDITRDRLVVGTQGRGVWSAPILTPCPGDWNADGSVNTLDVLAFLNDWAAADPRADVNGDGTVNTLDVLAFLNDWNAGCP